MIDDLKKGYYLLFIDGGIRGEPGKKKGAIGVILQEPDCGEVLVRVPKKVGSVGSPLEAEYHALIHGLKIADAEGLPYVAVFSDSRTLVNQMTRGWNKNGRAAELHAEAEAALKRFKEWQLSWVPREMNGDADKLVGQAFNGEPVTHATD